MTNDDLNAIIEAGNIPEDMTPGAVYIVVCDLAARVKELEAVLGRVREKPVLYRKCSRECQEAFERSGHSYFKSRAELYDVIARELGKLLEGIE